MGGFGSPWGGWGSLGWGLGYPGVGRGPCRVLTCVVLYVQPCWTLSRAQTLWPFSASRSTRVSWAGVSRTCDRSSGAGLYPLDMVYLGGGTHLWDPPGGTSGPPELPPPMRTPTKIPQNLLSGLQTGTSQPKLRHPTLPVGHGVPGVGWTHLWDPPRARQDPHGAPWDPQNSPL